MRVERGGADPLLRGFCMEAQRAVPSGGSTGPNQQHLLARVRHKQNHQSLQLQAFKDLCHMAAHVTCNTEPRRQGHFGGEMSKSV